MGAGVSSLWPADSRDSTMFGAGAAYSDSRTGIHGLGAPEAASESESDRDEQTHRLLYFQSSCAGTTKKKTKKNSLNCYVIHDFGKDESGRDVYHCALEMVSFLREHLEITAFATGEKLLKNVFNFSDTTVTNADICIVLITKRLMNTLEEDFPNNKCREEFLYAVDDSCRRNGMIIVPVVMEQGLMSPSIKWSGPLCMLEKCNTMGVLTASDVLDRTIMTGTSSPADTNRIPVTTSSMGMNAHVNYSPPHHEKAARSHNLTALETLKFKKRALIDFTDQSYAAAAYEALQERIFHVLDELYYPCPIKHDDDVDYGLFKSVSATDDHLRMYYPDLDGNRMGVPRREERLAILRNLRKIVDDVQDHGEPAPEFVSSYLPYIRKIASDKAVSLYQQLLRLILLYHMTEDLAVFLKYLVELIFEKEKEIKVIPAHQEGVGLISPPTISQQNIVPSKRVASRIDGIPLGIFNYTFEIIAELIKYDKRNQTKLGCASCEHLNIIMDYLDARLSQEQSSSHPSLPLNIYPCAMGLVAMNMLCRYGSFKFTLNLPNLVAFGVRAVDLIVKLLSKCDFFDRQLMQLICSLVSSLACDQLLAQHVWIAGLPEVLARALSVYSSSSCAVCRAASCAIRYLTVWLKQDRKPRRIPYACKALIYCLKNYGKYDLALAEHATAALANLDPNDLPNVVKMNHLGYVETLFSMLAVHGERYAAVAEYGMEVVWFNFPRSDTDPYRRNGTIWSKWPSHIKKQVSKQYLHLSFPSQFQCPHCQKSDGQTTVIKGFSRRSARAAAEMSVTAARKSPNRFETRRKAETPKFTEKIMYPLKQKKSKKKSLLIQKSFNETVNTLAFTYPKLFSSAGRRGSRSSVETVDRNSRYQVKSHSMSDKQAKKYDFEENEQELLNSAFNSPVKSVASMLRQPTSSPGFLLTEEDEDRYMVLEGLKSSPPPPSMSPSMSSPFVTVMEGFMRTTGVLPSPVQYSNNSNPSKPVATVGPSPSLNSILYFHGIPSHRNNGLNTKRQGSAGSTGSRNKQLQSSPSGTYQSVVNEVIISKNISILGSSLNNIAAMRASTVDINEEIDETHTMRLGRIGSRLLTRDTSNSDPLVEIGACEFVANMLLRNRLMTTIFMTGYESWVISNFTSSFASLMHKYNDSGSAISERCLTTICVICSDNCSNLSMLGELGIIDLVIALALRYGKTRTSIVEQILWCIGNLARDSANRVKLGSMGACELSLAMLNYHGKEDVAVVEQALWAIGHLARNNINARKLGDQNICKIIVEIFSIYGLASSIKLGFIVEEPRSHKTWAVRVLELCFWVIRVLAWNKKSECILDFGDVCRPLVEVYVRLGRYNSQIAVQGAHAIRNLYFYNESCALKLCQLDALKLVNGMRKYYSSQAHLRNIKSNQTHDEFVETAPMGGSGPLGAAFRKQHELPHGLIPMKGRVGLIFS